MLANGILLGGFMVLFLILISRSFKLMNTITIGYALMTTSIAAYILVKVKLPVFFLDNQYLFMDTLSVYEILISGFIFLLAALYARGYVNSLIKAGELNPKNVKMFYISFNLLLLSVILAFTSNNLALLWIFAELTTVFSAVLIVTLNAKENIAAAMKYVFIASTAMLFSFIGLIFLFAASKSSMAVATLNWNALLEGAGFLSQPLLMGAFVLIFVGFAAKSGIAPFHTWLPAAYAKAPSDVSVLLSGSVTNIGMYAIIRVYALAAHSPAASFIAKLLLVFGILSVGIAALSMVVRYNVKKLIAFSSIENSGIMLIGIGVGNLFWVLFHMLAHALAKAALFFSAGIIHRQYNSIRVEFIHNLFKLQPLAGWGLILGSIAVIGMPLSPLFFSKFYILASLGRISLWLLLAVLLFLLIGVCSFAWLLIRLMQMQGKSLAPFRVPLSMKFPIIIALLVLFILTIYFPALLTTTLQTITQQLGV
ncbi:hydrogenase membrane subunit [Candidatus Woesearchaeota archaeon]|nr:hydrogenase membrane subunit [Candidatus Woesearchaeota archaeon]